MMGAHLLNINNLKGNIIGFEFKISTGNNVQNINHKSMKKSKI